MFPDRIPDLAGILPTSFAVVPPPYFLHSQLHDQVSRITSRLQEALSQLPTATSVGEAAHVAGTASSQQQQQQAPASAASRQKVDKMSAEVVDSNPYSRLMALQRMGIVKDYERIRHCTVGKAAGRGACGECIGGHVKHAAGLRAHEALRSGRVAMQRGCRLRLGCERHTVNSAGQLAHGGPRLSTRIVYQSGIAPITAPPQPALSTLTLSAGCVGEHRQCGCSLTPIPPSTRYAGCCGGHGRCGQCGRGDADAVRYRQPAHVRLRHSGACQHEPPLLQVEGGQGNRREGRGGLREEELIYDKLGGACQHEPELWGRGGGTGDCGMGKDSLKGGGAQGEGGGAEPPCGPSSVA